MHPLCEISGFFLSVCPDSKKVQTCVEISWPLCGILGIRFARESANVLADDAFKSLGLATSELISKIQSGWESGARARPSWNWWEGTEISIAGEEVPCSQELAKDDATKRAHGGSFGYADSRPKRKVGRSDSLRELTRRPRHISAPIVGLCLEVILKLCDRCLPSLSAWSSAQCGHEPFDASTRAGFEVN